MYQEYRLRGTYLYLFKYSTMYDSYYVIYRNALERVYRYYIIKLDWMPKGTQRSGV